MKKLLAVLLAAVMVLLLGSCRTEQTSTVSMAETAKTKETDYLVLVNRTHPLPQDYESSVELTEAKNFFGKTFRIEKQTYEHFLQLREKMLLQEVQIEVNRAYLTAEEQTALIAQYTQDYGEEYAYDHQAKAGCSENQTGLSLDLALYFAGETIDTDEKLAEMEGIFMEIHAVLADYGFILRYPQEKVKETDVAYQPWHIRYVGEAAAKEIMENKITLEEYLS